MKKVTVMFILLLAGCANQPAWIEREREWYRQSLVKQLQSQLQACNDVNNGKCQIKERVAE